MNNEIKEEYLATLDDLQPKEAKRLIHYLAGYAMGFNRNEEMVMEMIIKQVKEIRERG